MAHIVLYTKTTCPFCLKAKALLNEKGITEWEEHALDQHPEKRDEMIEKSGGRKTVPQIFIDGKHIGGCDDLFAADERGELDALLK